MQSFLGEVSVFLNAACFFQNFPKRDKRYSTKELWQFFLMAQ